MSEFIFLPFQSSSSGPFSMAGEGEIYFLVLRICSLEHVVLLQELQDLYSVYDAFSRGRYNSTPLSFEGGDGG